MSQIVVGLVQPVLARRIEDVQVHGVFERPGLVGHVRGDAQHFAGTHHQLLAVDGKFQRAFENVGDLFVVVVMQRHVRTFFEQHARQHDFIADQHFAADEGIQLFALHVFPRHVLHFFSPYSLAALSCRYRRASSRAFSSLQAPSATSSARAAATAVRAERAASQKVSSAPTASLKDRKSTRLNSSHLVISYAVFCLKKKKTYALICTYRSRLHGLCVPRPLVPALVTALALPVRRSFSDITPAATHNSY